MTTGHEIALEWSDRFGLALAPLFESHDADALPGQHHVLLDGGLGTFALSTSSEELWRGAEPAGWAWSGNIPHHVTVTEQKIAVLRWDLPHEPRVFERRSVERSLDKFYTYLKEDRLRSSRGVVDHLLNYFRRLRSLCYNAGIADNRTTDVFLASLARLIAPDKAEAQLDDFGLAEDAASLSNEIAFENLAAAAHEAVSAPGTLSFLRLYPALAIRHAGGQLFQEAHFELLRVSPDFDLFGLVDAPETKIDSRGGAHFTPPALARSLVEQALAAIPDLQTRSHLTVCDPACGSGAFLHEAMRALRRAGFKGHLRLVGIDVSVAAAAMARFVVAVSARDWSPLGGISIEILVGDSLGEPGIPQADVVVMNPPFISFGAQTPEQRAQLRAATDSSAARGDYSMAFVARALSTLNPGGVLGTLFPASLLSLKAAESWRERIASEGQVRLLASIGDFGLFSYALVQVASAVIRKGGAEPTSAMTAVLTENDPAATGEALRQVRKLGGSPPSSPIIEDRWSIFPVQTSTLAKRATWRLPTPATERLLSALSDLSLPTVGELFHVAQGIQTGLNDVFLLLPEEWRVLPPKERRYFRKATMTDSIENGHVAKPYHLFFPHTADGPLFREEAALVEAVPTYFRTYLAPNRQRLQARASIVRSRRSDWWGLMHPRTWAFDKGPRVITKFFASEGGFVGDFKGEYLVVMGHVWVPQPILLDIDKDQLSSAEIVSAYVALFNSGPFVKLLSFYAPHVAGGQFDLSARHVNPIPLPDLRALSLDPAKGRHVSELARLARKIDLSDPAWSSVTAKLVMDLYGAQIVSLS